MDNIADRFDRRRIPFALHAARWRVLAAIYRDRIWRDIPVSLTLGGVLGMLALETGTTWRGSLLFAVFVSSTLLVPLVRAFVLPLEERVAVVRRLAPSRRHQVAVFNYVIFQFHETMGTVLDRIEQSEQLSKREVEFLFEYPRLLSSQLFGVFGFRTVDSFLSYLRFPIDALVAAIKVFSQATSRNMSKSVDSPPAERHEAQSRVNAARQRLRELYNRFAVTRDASLVYEGLRIVTTPGTSSAVGELGNVLWEIKDSNRRKLLLDLVDTARGHSLIRLASLEDWWKHGCEGDFDRHILQESDRGDVGGHFRALVNEKFWSARNRPYRLGIVTSGFSEAVLICLHKISEGVRFVCVVETDQYHLSDNAQMVARLQELDIAAWTISQDELQRQIERTAVHIAVFGFETISFRGDILHPRSTPHPIAVALKAFGGKNQVVVAAGECWKVVDFDAEQSDPSFIAVYGAAGFTHIVTSHQVHDVSGDLNLKCCREAAARQRSDFQIS